MFSSRTLADRPRTVLLAALVALTLSGCAPYVDEFAIACDKAGGELLESSQTKTTTGVGIGGDGSPVVTTGSVTFTMRICLANDGTVIDAVLE